MRTYTQSTLDFNWCQRWRERRHSWRHTSEGGFDRRRYDVDPCPHEEAKTFVVAQHYSGSFPASRRCYSLRDRQGLLVGAAVLSVPSHPKVLTNVFPGRSLDELAELGRFVLLDEVPAPAESWMIARVLELAARDGIHGIVAFSDPVPRTTSDGAVVFPGHVGHIYRASSARYCGRSRARMLHVLPSGQVLSERTISKILSGQIGLGGRRQRRLPSLQAGDGPMSTSWTGKLGVCAQGRAVRRFVQTSLPGHRARRMSIKRMFSTKSPRRRRASASDPHATSNVRASGADACGLKGRATLRQPAIRHRGVALGRHFGSIVRASCSPRRSALAVSRQAAVL